ncbi:MAG: hypothetical protein ACK4V2_07270 [Pseudomonadota bacterium]|jgi:hypothetical protein|nr:hypothetical protein [Alphaproteobacteria bacterium]
MKKILFVLFSALHIYSAIVEALIEPEKPRYPQRAFATLERSKIRNEYWLRMPHEETTKAQEEAEETTKAQAVAAEYEKKLEEYNGKLNEYHERQKVFWSGMRKKAEEWWADMPKWEDDFPIFEGHYIVHHDEYGVRIAPNFVFNQSEDEFSHYKNPSNEIYISQYRGKALEYPLRLKVHSSRNDFLAELIFAKVYNPPIRQTRKIFSECEGEHTVVNLYFYGECRTIKHGKRGITLRNEYDDILYYRENGELKAHHKVVPLYRPDGTMLCLHYQQSYYEFVMRLAETGHISFAEYPAYTTQGRSQIDGQGRERRYYECYYYGPLTSESDPNFKRKQQSVLRQEQLRLKQEQKRIRREAREKQRLAAIEQKRQEEEEQPHDKNGSANSKVINEKDGKKKVHFILPDIKEIEASGSLASSVEIGGNIEPDSLTSSPLSGTFSKMFSLPKLLGRKDRKMS